MGQIDVLDLALRWLTTYAYVTVHTNEPSDKEMCFITPAASEDLDQPAHLPDLSLLCSIKEQYRWIPSYWTNAQTVSVLVRELRRHILSRRGLSMLEYISCFALN